MLASKRVPPWRHRLAETYDVLARLRDCRTASALGRTLLEFIRPYGATNLLAGIIPSPNALPKEQRSHVVLDAWPAEWARRYFSKGYLFQDPTIHLVRTRIDSFRWEEIDRHGAISSRGRRVMNEAKDFGLQEGITFSFATLNHGVVGFSIASQRIEIPDADLSAISLILSYALGCAMSLPTEEASDRIHLSFRQREALSWVAEGLTVEQTANRMGVATHTVDMHLRIARRKLGVSNSTHAIAEAFRRGLIN